MSLPILLQHGIGSTRQIWQGWTRLLEPEHRCLLPEIPGHGDAAPQSAPWSIDGLVAGLIAELDKAGIERAHLVGESLGGTLVLAAAIQHPGRVASVTMSNAGYRGGAIASIASWRGIFENEGIDAWNAMMMRNRFGDDWDSNPALDHAALIAYAKRQRAIDPAVTLGLGEMLSGVDLSEGLKSLRVPLLVLLPDSSPFVLLHTAPEIKALQPDADICVFAATRHGLPLLRPGDCVRELQAFFARRRL